MSISVTDSSSVPVSNKERRSKSKWIFTLLFLLILIIFGALYFGPPILLEARAQSRHAEAKAQANQIGEAVTSYYYDNNTLPVPSGTKPVPGGTVFSTNTADGLAILNLLVGNNPRKVTYMNLRAAKDRKNGAVYGSAGQITGLYDPWGNPYMIVMDTNSDAKLTVPFKIPVFINGKLCSVYSAGQDGVLETTDDVKTWP